MCSSVSRVLVNAFLFFRIWFVCHVHGGDLDTDDEESDDDQENTETPEEERRDTQGPDDVGLFGHSVRDLDAFQATDEYDESYTSGEMPDLRNIFTANSTLSNNRHHNVQAHVQAGQTGHKLLRRIVGGSQDQFDAEHNFPHMPPIRSG